MSKKIKSPHPQWALKHRRPGTELRKINGKYYLYEYKTVYDPKNKRPKKISGPLLGSISEEGFAPSAKRSLEHTIKKTVLSKVVTREYGVSFLIGERFKVYLERLESHFSRSWKQMVAIAYCRFVYRCPLKNIPFRLESSFLPELLGMDPFNEKTSSVTLKQIGGMQGAMNDYMRSFIHKGDHILFDVTDVFSESKNIALARKGYNGHMNYDSHFNLMYVFSTTSQMPVFYRLLPGNIREVKAFKNTLREVGLLDAIVVADKGFYSATNLELLKKERLNYILPLKRDNQVIDYSQMEKNRFKTGDSFFLFNKRPIWFREYPVNDKDAIYMFLDEKLKVKEDLDYLTRIHSHPETHSVEQYHIKRNRFGTMAMISNLDRSGEEIYQTYKSRGAIEMAFDGMKNVLESDHTYMQDEQTLKGWMFINHIALQWYQQLYIELKNKELLKKISVNDYIQLLTDVKKIKINDHWYLNEFTSQTQKLMQKLGLSIEM